MNQQEHKVGMKSLRRCVGCGHSDAKTQVLRFVLDGNSGQIAPDLNGRLGGRGVSVHPSGRCIQHAVRGGFSRALRRAVKMDAQQVTHLARLAYARRVHSLLGVAFRCAKVVLGSDAVNDTIRSGKPILVLIAEDAAPRTMRIENKYDQCLRFGDKTSLGKLFGRDEVALVGVLDEQIGKEITSSLANMASIVKGE